MIIAIHQPEHMPWLGFFDKMRRVELFVLLDTTQFAKDDFQNRNRIKTREGPSWLTVPVYKSGASKQLITEARICNERDWRRRCFMATILVRASALGIHEQGGTNANLAICRAVGAHAYLSGKYGRHYLDESRFAEHDIRVEYQEFRHPVYPQLWGEFAPSMSAIDLLFNCGPTSLEIIAEANLQPLRSTELNLVEGT
jgi:hypothetical protein